MNLIDLQNSEHLSEQLDLHLREQFQLKAFRAGQLEAMLCLLQEKRLLCIQPTGHGKSLLYQLPSTILPGMTLVISPLLALMRDQIHHLRQRFNITAASINSDQTEEDNAKAQRESVNGQVKILFVSPEKLDNLQQLQFLSRLPFSLIVIDEAHCISTWGHDFRPSYRQIMPFIQTMENTHPELLVLALTATANAKTEEDISQQLAASHRKIRVQRQGMQRDNIELSILRAADLSEKLSLLKQLMPKLSGHGIIYCATRDNTELIADFLQEQGVKAVAYHAGYDPYKKQQLQEKFIGNHYKVMAATNALGMGIDKQDLRFIIHFDIPGSITAYYQEVGRCGRDGLPAQGILLCDHNDLKIQHYFINSAQPDPSHFPILMRTLQKHDSLGLLDLKRLTGFHPTEVNLMLAELIEQGFIRKKLQYGKQVYLSTDKMGTPDLSRYQTQLQLRSQELNAIKAYTEDKKTCLMQVLSQALGDLAQYRCGLCDNCQGASFKLKDQDLKFVKDWLLTRNVSIQLSKLFNAEQGVSILDGQMRSPLFIDFMKGRAVAGSVINPLLLQAIQTALQKLCEQHQFSAILSLPSRTWANRQSILQFMAETLKVPMFSEVLSWKEMPENRQGELLNNDQRRYNVDRKMHCVLSSPLPAGTILLVDDYVGSGATLNEALRALKPFLNANTKILPFTMASVRWRLGQRGMI